MEQGLIFLTIVGMMLVTYIPRALPVLALAKRTLPEPMVRWLSFIPTAVLSALLAPSLVLRDNAVALDSHNVFLLASIPCFLLAWKTRSFFGTVALGMALVAGMRYFGL